MGGYRINENTWNFSADFQGGSLIATGETVTEPLTFVDAYDGVTDYDGPSGATVPYHGTATTTVGYLPGDADFWDFEGLGTLPLDVATNIFSSYTVYGSPTTSGLHTETTWTATVTYTYDPAVAAETKTWGEVKSLYR
jgi:hypothetical protein